MARIYSLQQLTQVRISHCSRDASTASISACNRSLDHHAFNYGVGDSLREGAQWPITSCKHAVGQSQAIQLASQHNVETHLETCRRATTFVAKFDGNAMSVTINSIKDTAISSLSNFFNKTIILSQRECFAILITFFRIRTHVELIAFQPIALPKNGDQLAEYTLKYFHDRLKACYGSSVREDPKLDKMNSNTANTCKLVSFGALIARWAMRMSMQHAYIFHGSIELSRTGLE